MSTNEVTGKIVAYDLRSENMTIYAHDRDAKNKARATRVYCTEKLHSLGLQCTESVILVSPSRMNAIDGVLQKTSEKYLALKGWLQNRNIRLDRDPHVEVIEIYGSQQERFRRLAERRLIERLDDSIDRLSGIIGGIDQITEHERRRALRYRLTQLNSEWRTIQSLANELEINVSSDYRYLIDLIDEASRRVGD